MLFIYYLKNSLSCMFKISNLNDFSEEVNEADKDTSPYTNLTGIQTKYIIIFN